MGCLNSENAALVFLEQNCISWYVGTEPELFNIKVHTLDCLETEEADLICTKFEIAVLNDGNCEFREQKSSGCPYDAQDGVLFRNFFIDDQAVS